MTTDSISKKSKKILNKQIKQEREEKKSLDMTTTKE